MRLTPRPPLHLVERGIPPQTGGVRRNSFYHLNRPQRIPGATGAVLICGRRDKTAAVPGEAHSW